MRIRWIVPLYDFPPGINQFCLPENRRDRLLDLAALADTDDLLAAYVTQTLGFADDPNNRIENFISAYRGRIAGLMRVLPLPTDGRVEDYNEPDWDNPNNPRWPVGLPAKAVRRPPPNDCPEISIVFEHGNLPVPNFNQGPVELTLPISNFLLQRLPDVLDTRTFPPPPPDRRPARQAARRWR